MTLETRNLFVLKKNHSVVPFDGDKIKSDRFGIHNFTNFLMKFSSRPDYYNRCVIFGS